MTNEDRRSGTLGLPGRTRDRLCHSASLQCQPDPVHPHDDLSQGRGERLALMGPRWRTRSYAELRADACRWGHGFELPDRRMTLKAVVVMNGRTFEAAETTRRLQDYVKAKLLPYKYPREIAFLDELPKTGTGKIDRQAVMRI